MSVTKNEFRVRTGQKFSEPSQFHICSVDQTKGLYRSFRSVGGGVVELTHGFIDVPLTIAKHQAEIFVGSPDQHRSVGFQRAQEAKRSFGSIRCAERHTLVCDVLIEFLASVVDVRCKLGRGKIRRIKFRMFDAAAEGHFVLQSI